MPRRSEIANQLAAKIRRNLSVPPIGGEAAHLLTAAELSAVVDPPNSALD